MERVGVLGAVGLMTDCVQWLKKLLEKSGRDILFSFGCSVFMAV